MGGQRQGALECRLNKERLQLFPLAPAHFSSAQRSPLPPAPARGQHLGIHLREQQKCTPRRQLQHSFNYPPCSGSTWAAVSGSNRKCSTRQAAQDASSWNQSVRGRAANYHTSTWHTSPSQLPSPQGLQTRKGFSGGSTGCCRLAVLPGSSAALGFGTLVWFTFSQFL